MKRPDNNKIIIIAMMVVLLVGFSIWKNSDDQIQPSNSSVSSLTAEQVIKQSVMVDKKEITLTVYISGGVVKPGLYQVQPGSRVNTVITMAGGFSDNADKAKVNLAKINKDGAHILVPLLKTVSSKQAKKTNPTVQSVAVDQENTKTVKEKININTASLEELIALPGIGVVTAEKIITYRNKNGRFKSIEELKNITGIGTAKLKNLIDLVSI